jgi:hypothetical protein
MVRLEKIKESRIPELAAVEVQQRVQESELKDYNGFIGRK